MEARTGPLSYDLDFDDRETSAERPILVGGGLTFAAGVALLVGGWAAMAVIPSRGLVLFGTPALIVALAVALTLLLTRSGTQRRRRNAAIANALVGVFVAYFVGSLLAATPPTVVQLESALDSVDMPGGLRVATEEVQGGRWCSPRCPRITRVYRTDTELPNPVQTVVAALLDQGWSVGDANIPEESATSARRGAFFIDLYGVTGVTDEIRVVITSSGAAP